MLGIGSDRFDIPSGKWTLLMAGNESLFVYLNKRSVTEYDLAVEIPQGVLENLKYTDADSGNLLKDGHLSWWPKKAWNISSDQCIRMETKTYEYSVANLYIDGYQCKNTSMYQVVEVGGVPYTIWVDFPDSYDWVKFDDILLVLDWLDGNMKSVRSETLALNGDGRATGIMKPEGSKYLNLTVKLQKGWVVGFDRIYFGTVPLHIDGSYALKAASPSAAGAPIEGNVTKQAVPENPAAEKPKEGAPSIWTAILDFIRKLFGFR